MPHRPVSRLYRPVAVLTFLALGVGSLSVTAASAATDTTAPGVPGNLKTAYYGQVGVSVSWGKVSASDTAGYRVYRSAGKTIVPATDLLGSTTTALTFTDTTAVAGKTYYYAVAAIDKTGNLSKPSSAVTVKAVDTDEPDKPGSLKLTPSADGVAVSWSAVAAVPDLAGYVVARSSSSGGTFTQLTNSPYTATSFLDSAAPAGSTSYYRVTAVDRTGNASSAATASATRPASTSTPPPTPAGFTAKATSSGATLTWTANTGSTTSGYVVKRATAASGPFVALTATPVTGTSFADTTAPAGAKAYYQLVAVNAAGASAPAATSVSVPKDTTPPAKPSGLKTTAAATGITLTWSANKEADLRGYLVYRSASSSGTYSQLTPAALTATSYTDTTAPAGAKAYYRVTAVDVAGNASSAATGSATRPADPLALPPTPAGFTAVAGKTGGVVLTWTANATATTTGYSVLRAASASGPFTALTGTPITGTSLTDATAPTGATSYYRLTAVNTAGVSPAATASVTLAADTKAPAAPSSAKATVAAAGGMTVTWAANKETDLAGYTVQKRNSDEVYVDYLPAAGATFTATTFTDPTITEGTRAYFRIRAVDTTGNVSSYGAVTAANPMVKPAAPTGLKAAADPTHGIALTWAANRETDLAGYNVSRSSSSGGSYVLLGTLPAAKAGTAPRFVDTSAPKGVPQFYKVTALDLVGNVSALSGSASATSATDPVALPIDYVHLYVAADGANGAFRTITEALASIPAANLQPTMITIAAGAYHESFEITSPNVVLTGATGDPADVVIADDKASGTADPAGGTYGTADSRTVFVSAKNVTLRNLTVANTFDEKAHPEITSQQAVALRVEGDRFTADHVRLIGNQDTLLADTPKPTTRSRQYYVNSYIEGDVDYIFGAAGAVFDRVTLRSLDRGKSDNGAITAPSTDKGSKYGFLFVDSKVVSDAAAGTVHLGRPWHPSADPDAIGSAVFVNTWLPAAIDAAAPWEDMATADSSGTKVNFRWQDARFDEYRSIGPGATLNANRPQLTDKEAANATPAKYLAGSDGWSPMLPATTAVPSSPTGLAAATDTRVVHLTWNDDTSADVIGWNVYRADAGTGALTKIAAAVAPTFSDTTVTNGASYAYAVTAVSRGGAESPATIGTTVTVAAAPLVADLTVDPAATADGRTTFTTLTAALAAAPAGTATDPTVISVAKGTYDEYLTIAKPYVIVVGATGTAGDVVINGDRAAGTPIPGAAPNPDGTPATYGTSGSATVVVTGNAVQMRDLTIQNSYKEGTYPSGQAVALRTVGDKLVFDNVRLLGNQDTLYANSPATTTQSRVYFHDAYIEGDVDFIFGRATAVFDHSTLKALDHATSPNGAVTAASTDVSQKYGFLITDSRIIGSAPDGSQNLGRPWQPGKAQADGTSAKDDNALGQVVVRDSWLSSVVSTTATWTDMTNSGVVTDWRTARFAEYANTGPGSGTGATADRPQLTADQAGEYTAAAYLAGADGWNPVADAATDVAPAAVTGLVAGAADKAVNLTWDDSVESDVTAYRVYRADQLVATVAKAAYTDKAVTNGTEYTYTVVAVDAAGNAAPASATATATPGVAPLVADLTVAADGSGDHTTLQAAVAAAPAGTAGKPTVILIKPGTYRQVVTIAKPYLVIAGASGDARDVVLTYDNANGTPAGPATCPTVTAATCGTSGSFSVAVTAGNVTVRDLTIANTFDAAKHPEIGGNNTQAVALKATGDRQVYRNVRLLGTQDTLLADSAGNISATGAGYARQYYADSFIEGNVDFVFGRATAVFDRVTIHATTRNGGTIFAPSTASKNPNGYLVTNSRIVSANDPGTFTLGRPWQGWGDGSQPDNSRGQLTIRDTTINDGINAARPWADFAPLNWTDGRLTEYRNTGAGATVNANRPQLSDAEAATRTPAVYLAGTDGWNPVADAAADVAPAAPRGVTARGGAGQVTLSWDENAEADVTGYRVYRATGGGSVPLDADHQVGGALLTRAGLIDTGLANGTAYGYAVVAVDAAGHTSAASATVTATPAQRVDATVSADGSGTYPTLQAALDAAGGSANWVVSVGPGTYAGPVTVTKANVTLVGATGNPDDVVITNGTSAAALSISGSSVTVRDLTVRNTTASGAAPAVSMTGDKVLLEHVTLKGTNRTVFADTSTYTASARQMIDNSVIEGTGDIVLGRATLVINETTIAVKAGGGTVLTPSTAATFKGMLLINSTVTTPAGVTNVQLGRPYRAWGDQYTPNSVGQAVIRETSLGAGVNTAQPWGTGPAGEPWTLGRLAEYANTGDGAGVNGNRPQLTAAGSVTATVTDWLGAATWYPAVPAPAAPATPTAPTAPTTPPTPGGSTLEAPAGLTTVLGKGSVTVSWSAVDDSDLAGYDVYRSSGGAAPDRLTSGVTATSYTDTTVTAGTAYSYTVVAVDTAGNGSEPSEPATATPVKADVVVAADGSGDATTVAAGIALLADNADYTTQGYRVILIKPGTYAGVVASGNRYGVTLLGATSDASDTVLTAGGTGSVATVTLSGNQWTLRNLTVANTNGATQATALQVKSGDKDVFDNVRFLGDKQTLLLSTANVTTYSRLYFRDSYIEGGADMVLGRAVAVFDRSTFHVLARSGASLTDSSISSASPYGFLITDSTIITDGAANSIYLGRPYSTTGQAQVVVRNTRLGSAINTAQPWNNWDAATPWTAGRFFEYQNTGPGAEVVTATTRPMLSSADAANYTAPKYLAGADGWNPTGN
ncbi:pectinesterase family protein [Actinoplanes missouriensis]|uniref:pectinesterase family protein n=1 Tax=Actinoplanes missouriensis TaxID=1866 RepID=UPI0033C24FD4